MSEEHIKIVEINGIKMEVDLRTAKKVEHFKVGDRVKVLIKEYNDWKTHHGVIVAFDQFENLPSICVCYMKYSGLEFATINSKSKDVEICACNDDVIIEQGSIIDTFTKDIERKKAEIRDIEAKINYFNAQFGRWFKPETEEV